MRAIKDEYSILTGWAPIAVAATKTTASIDFRNCEQNMIIIEPGLWTDGTHTFSMTDSPDNTTFTAVTSTNIIGTLPVWTSTTAAVAKVSYIGPNPYVKVIDTGTVVTTGMVIGVHAIAKYRKQPGP